MQRTSFSPDCPAASSLAPLQRVLNAAARFVADLHPRDHVTATLRDLHWLPIKTRITYKLCTLMHASVFGAARVYIRNMYGLLRLNCLVARTFVLLRLVYTTCREHERNLGPDLSQLPDRQLECSASRAARNR